MVCSAERGRLRLKKRVGTIQLGRYLQGVLSQRYESRPGVHIGHPRSNESMWTTTVRQPGGFESGRGLHILLPTVDTRRIGLPNTQSLLLHDESLLRKSTLRQIAVCIPTLPHSTLRKFSGRVRKGGFFDL